MFELEDDERPIVWSPHTTGLQISPLFYYRCNTEIDSNVAYHEVSNREHKLSKEIEVRIVAVIQIALRIDGSF